MKVRFPAMKAIMGRRAYYITSMALSEVPRFFKFNDWNLVDPSLRAQRVLNVSRVPDITRYILDNEEGYIFSSITASYSSEILYIPSADDDRVGVLEMDLEGMEFIINDGQHRAAAIAAALKESPELGKERISVLLFPTEDLNRLQQMFSDLNRFVHKTSKSLDILYDHRDSLSTLTMQVAEDVDVFCGMIDKERMSIPLRSPKLLTLSSLYDANSELLGSEIDKPSSNQFKEHLAKATEYWQEVAKHIQDWQKVKDGQLQAPALRQEKINTHGVVLRALGGVGNVLFQIFPENWREHLHPLESVDWRKSVGGHVNPLWDNVCVVAGSVVSNRQGRVATLAVLKDRLDLRLTAQEAALLRQLREPMNASADGHVSATSAR